MNILNKRIVDKKSITDSSGRIGTMLSVIFFVCGVLLGTFTVSTISETGSSALYGEVAEYIDQLESGGIIRADIISAIISAFKYPLLVFFLGFSIPGFALVPAVVGIRGFYLSFSIATFVKVFGSGGALVAFGLFGLTALITVPCLFVLSARSFSSSYGLWRIFRGKSRAGMSRNLGSGNVFFGVITLAVLFASVLIELYITPLFVSAVSVFIK